MLSHQFCAECGKETPHHNMDCAVCAGKERQVEEAKWKALSVEEKIEVLRARIDNIGIENLMIG